MYLVRLGISAEVATPDETSSSGSAFTLAMARKP
jgi:hypothetical protein